MGDLISRIALLGVLNALLLSDEAEQDMIERIIKYAPTVDAVNVVRCRNCKYYKAVTDSIGTCTMVNMNSTPEGYCAWAERETNEI